MYDKRSPNRNFQGAHSPPPKLPRVRIETFYVNGTKDIRPELFDKTADAIAGSFVVVEYRYGVGRTQLRRLYNEVKRFEQKLDGTKETWNKHCPYIKMIKSKACYNIIRAKGKEGKKEGVYTNLLDFITEGIDLIKYEEDYRAFTALFEAVYGFYYDKSKGFEKEN